MQVDGQPKDNKIGTQGISALAANQVDGKVVEVVGELVEEVERADNEEVVKRTERNWGS